MIWLQEYGTKTGANRPDYKLFIAKMTLMQLTLLL